jgi:hypothetical protein
MFARTAYQGSLRLLWQCGSRGKPEPVDYCGISKAKKPIGET